MHPDVQIEALGVPGQEVVVDAREIVKTVQLSGAGKLQQVFITSFIFRQQQQMGGAFIVLGIATLSSRAQPGRPQSR